MSDEAPQPTSPLSVDAEDNEDAVPDAASLFGGLLDPDMMKDAKWQNDKMKAFHKTHVPLIEWELSAILAHLRAQSAKMGLTASDVKEPPMGAALKAELEALAKRGVK